MVIDSLTIKNVSSVTWFVSEILSFDLISCYNYHESTFDSLILNCVNVDLTLRPYAI